MDRIIFATNNRNKVEELKTITGDAFNIVSLRDAGIEIEIPEPHDTLEANATEKSRTIFKITGSNCFSEDTGLEVDVLNGEPGVKSARYAGNIRSDMANIEKLLKNLKGVENRKARFRTVISLILNGVEYLFDGICEGHITVEPRGTRGFGYDSIFIPEGAFQTFAEMALEVKNKFSHRKKATEKLKELLRKSSFH
jgi:XTP/dITP diphosphohydrolase